jgi:hypothetical protein
MASKEEVQSGGVKAGRQSLCFLASLRAGAVDVVEHTEIQTQAIFEYRYTS